jgi:hypothetical protein
MTAFDGFRVITRKNMSNTTLRKNQKNQLNNTGINQQKLRAFAGELLTRATIFWLKSLCQLGFVCFF